MFDSFGLGELGIVIVLVVIFVQPKDIGRFLRWFAQVQNKLYRFQRDLRGQLENLAAEDEALQPGRNAAERKRLQRELFCEKVRHLTALEKHQAAEALHEKLRSWQPYLDAKCIGAFCSHEDEIDTEPLMRKMLVDGKTLLLPRVSREPDTSMTLHEVNDLDADLELGTYGIFCPRVDPDRPQGLIPDLILVPGLAFDLHGGRLGKGKGYYDRFLASIPAVKVGLGYDVQVWDKMLALEAHDVKMDYLLSERRIQKTEKAELKAGIQKK